MPDLIVDATLDDTNAHLKAIHDEFAHAKDHAKEDGWIWGQWDIGHAMTEFVQNWWVHREKIDKRLEELSKKVDDCCTTWADADKQLVENLEKDHA